MSDFVYAPGQVKNIMDLVDDDIRWFLLGGPADGDEAQVLHEARPDIRILGFEPNPVMFKIQSERGFPGLLLPVALWKSMGQIRLNRARNARDDELQKDRASSVVKWADDREGYEVQTATLDDLSKLYGPFDRSVLWIDIEEAELACLQGAKGLLNSKSIRLINVEAYLHRARSLKEHLKRFGFKEIRRWNHHRGAPGREWWDIIYKLK